MRLKTQSVPPRMMGENKKMRAIVFDQPGDASVLHVSTVDVPSMKPTDVRIKVEAAGINRAELEQRAGRYPPPPGASPLLGLEAAGTIMEVGAEAAGDFKPGERVMALCNGGTYAEQVVVDAGSVMRVPDSFTMHEAATFMEATITAYLNIFHVGGAKTGSNVLVHGGGSGVGSQAIALCKAAGITSFVTAGSDEKCNLCLQRGASFVINYKSESFAEAVNGLSKGKGVDVIVDIVGAPYLEKDLECLAMDGRVIFIGWMGGMVAKDFNMTKVLSKRAHIIGSTLRNRTDAFKAELVKELKSQFKEQLRHGDLKPIVDKVFPFDSVADAHRRMESSAHFGNIVLSWTL